MPSLTTSSGTATAGTTRTADPVAVRWERYHVDRDVAIRNRLVEHYLPLVRYQAERLKAKLPANVDVDDLATAGAIGMMDAVEGFDPERGVKFQTYCAQRVKGAMVDELRREDPATRLLRHRATQLVTTEASLARELGRKPREDEMADALHLSIEDYRARTRATAAAARLSLQGADAEADENGARGLVLEDKRTEEPWAGLTRQDVYKFVTRDLQPKERMIITLYYYENLTMKEIGQVFGVTESRVCQIHKRILTKLREQLRGREGDL